MTIINYVSNSHQMDMYDHGFQINKKEKNHGPQNMLFNWYCFS